MLVSFILGFLWILKLILAVSIEMVLALESDSLFFTYVPFYIRGLRQVTFSVSPL